MDIQRHSKKTSLTKKYQIPLIVIALSLLSILVFQSQSIGIHSVQRDSLLLGKVQHGDFRVTVSGPGILVPKDIRWVAANVLGRVERILVKPGAQVNSGDVLLELSNPQLLQELEATQWELQATEAEIHANEVSLESQLLDQEANTLNAKLNYQNAKLRLDAQLTLLKQNNGAISQLDFEESKITTEQLLNRWQIEKKRLLKSEENIKARKKANQANLNRMQKTLQQIERQVDSLTVKASMSSVVQELPLELGQQVNVGNNIARLARLDELLAELQIPEMQIQQVAIGQMVIIDTHSNKISGLVNRIDPAVVNGVVQVDVAIQDDLPPEARPDLSIRGDIEVAFIAETLFVNRPVHARGMSKSQVFKLADNNQSAQSIAVEFGPASVSHIQVLQGLQAGDQIIVSDSSQWQAKTEFQIN